MTWTLRHFMLEAAIDLRPWKFWTPDGKPAEGTEEIVAVLEKNKLNGRSLFGLSETLKAQQKNREAMRFRRQFAAAWKNADIKLGVKDL